MGSGSVVVVASDDRWLRVLEVTLKLGGYEPVARRSVLEASRMRLGDERPRALVLDLGVDSMETDVQGLQELLSNLGLRTVVILPDRLRTEAARFEASGAQVLVRPYQPSSLYAALEAPAPGERQPVPRASSAPDTD